MIEKRFKSTLDEETMSIMPYLVSDKEEECFYNLQGCVDLLNEQEDELKLLRATNREQYEQIQQLNAFLVEKGIAEEFVKWCKEDE